MMKRYMALAVLSAITTMGCFAQNKTAIKYGSQITAADAEKHLSVLASDAYEGRNTGEKGGHMAADYLATYFKKLKLKAPVNGSYFQQVALIKKSLNDTSMSLNGENLTFLKDFMFMPNLDGLELNSSDLFFAGYGIASENYNDYGDANIQGKLVLILPGEPFGKDSLSLVSGTKDFSEWALNPRKKMETLQQKGAKAALIVSDRLLDNGAKYRSYLTGAHIQLASKEQEATFPVIYITSQLADKILESKGLSIKSVTESISTTQKSKSGTLKADIEVKISRKSEPVKAANVLGYLEGSDPELKKELVVITAHYDHVGIIDGKVYNGADDDGSGTTAVLEIAESFAKAKKAKKGPKRSILFMLVTGEEKGLLGSSYYVDHPVFPLENTITNLNIDMIGRVDEAHKGDSNYVYVIGSDKLSTDLHKINETANTTYTKMELDYKYNDPKDPNRFYYRSDHYNFAKNGIPIIFYFNGVHEDYHQASDEVDKINFDALTKRAQLVFYTAWDLANRDKRPVVDVKNDFPESR